MAWDRARRGVGWTAVPAGALALFVGARTLLAPGLSATDAPGFALVGGGALLEILAGFLLLPRRRRWRLVVGLAGWGWIGGFLAVLVLAYKDTLDADFAARGAWGLAADVVLHFLIWPAEVALSAALGFVDPWGPAYVVAGLAIGALAAFLLTRRPRGPRRVPQAAPSGGSSSGP